MLYELKYGIGDQARIPRARSSRGCAIIHAVIPQVAVEVSTTRSDSGAVQLEHSVSSYGGSYIVASKCDPTSQDRVEIIMPPTLADIPVELFLDNIFPLLQIPDLHSLGSTNKDFYKLTSDDTFWHRKIKADYNFSGSDTARTTGWKFIYKRLTNPKVYVWGYVPMNDARV